MKITVVKNYNNATSVIFNNKKDYLSFNGYWNETSLNILNRNRNELLELGEYFHKSSANELLKVSKITNFFGFTKKDSSNLAYSYLKQAVDEVLQFRKTLEIKLAELSKKDSENKITPNELLEMLKIRKRIDDLENKFDNRYNEFYKETELLSDDDIAYFKRYDNDY